MHIRTEDLINLRPRISNLSKMPVIAIVDDDESFRRATTSFVRSLGYGTAAFDSAEAFLKSERINDADCLITDVQMPGMTGLELATHLSSEIAGAPAIIFISAHDEYALKAFDVHALDYLLKPVRASRLAESIQRVCGLRMQLAQQKNAIPASLHHMGILEDTTKRDGS